MMGTERWSSSCRTWSNGQEAVCYAALVKKTKGMTKSNQPYIRCVFRDKRVDGGGAALVGSAASSRRPIRGRKGSPYRLQVRGKFDLRYGMQVDILGIRPATDDDAADGFDFADLVESSRYPADELLKKLHDLIERCIDQPAAAAAGGGHPRASTALFKKMPAAQGIHHSYTGGLLEHVWSMTRIASFLADHYAKYYDQLESPVESRAS